ncbi:hypothetical protein [Methylobacillus sp.]|uniref:hypothetical protein n=1 Tax=Methylobacillus sp. TaxID=56818 RepID=UPI0012CDE714|nr:hypothetical protein [Methylobacillus sp.]MPS48146.1 hypothetical protein [Methylobacillus sp.]
MMRVILLSLLLCVHVGAAAQSFGRLFTTPAERESLEKLRQHQGGQLLEQPVQAPAVSGQVPAPVPPQEFSVQGYIQRSDGAKGTVWINHQPLQEGSDNGQLQVGKVNRQGIPLTIHESGRQVRLKAGQAFNPDTDEIIERNVHMVAPGPATNPAEQGTIR